jgi:Holliday junction DNA helicase RuvA
VIAGLTGRVVRRSAGYVVIDVSGVHYKVSVSPQTLSAIAADGEQVQLSTFMYVREDVLQLYGFRSAEEQDLFERMLTVGGIGPKNALALVGALGADGLRQAIANADVDFLKRVPGIGLKTAQRIVLELKGKLVPGIADIAPAGSPEGELADALSGLGYSASEVASAVNYLKGVERPLEDRLRSALRFFVEGTQA